MDFYKIQNLVKMHTDPSRWSRGIKYFNRKLVDHVTFNINDSTITFEGIAESEFYNEVYPNSISIDLLKYKIVGVRCTCDDFRSRNTSSRLFICKHLAATTIAAVQSGIKDASNAQLNLFQEAPVNKLPTTPNAQLLSYFDDSQRELVNLEVNIEVESNKVTADFKIGTDKMYVLKSLKAFAESRINNTLLEYGKNFTYNPNIHYFDSPDEDIIDIIEDYGSNPAVSLMASHNTKLLHIGVSGFKRFLETLKNKTFTLIFNGREYHSTIIKDTLPVSFDFKKYEDKIMLTSQDDMPVPLTSKGDVVLYNENLYLLSNESARNYGLIYSTLTKDKDIQFNKQETEGLLGNLVPKIKELSASVNLDNEIKNNIVNDFNVKFYFDFKNSNVVCDLKFYYNDENGEKFILKNLEKEKFYQDKLLALNFSKGNKNYLFKGNDEDLFNFLNIEIMQLKDLGDVYYSDKFKSKKIYKASSIQASIRDSLDGYLDFSFNISDIDKKEYKDMLIAFKQNSKFYRLKDGSFMDLQDSKTQDFFELIENLDLVKNLDESKVHKSKMLYINEMLNTKNLDFIEGRESVKNICDKFKNIENINLGIPKNLTANLRDYQVSGLNWFKTLDHYEFGGILADEMGLGKTIQTISFLLAKRESRNENLKTLIITPTSLVYNWKNEFETFAPTMKVLLIHGNKTERKKALLDKDNYDVIITTYGTLRNDLDCYSKEVFDYCIIDEAQNIKNPIALSTDAVKSINAKVRFALTGTPIENNLLELWSIFDFIMPGYLYSRSKFQDLFIYDEYNAENLKKLIKPFILRRTKNEVMKELPEKIEKKFFVELNKDQRKIYSAYINEIQEKMSNRDLKTDKITLFSYLTKLRQLCLDPSVLVEGYNKKSSKIETTLEILKDAIDNNHKILLFSQFTSVLKNIGKELSKNNISYSYIDGQTPPKNRIDLVNKFNETDEDKVFLISLKAGGTGLNLTSADIVIHFDPWWNPSVENQASDRAHRYGQKNVVEVIKLIAKGTIEEKIIKLQENKNELIEEFINGDLSNSSLLKSLSDNDIIDLFN
ncbi:SNF2 helicase associated domain-containing protein [Romboutsia sp.]|uniref:DEAD/DEAH box helicase n=1 Tax=Romboutsia sp. TaxID=1965302 RepID=UPI003F3E540D